MPLLLKQVEPGRGALWVRDAFRLYARRPLAFTLMFVSYLAAVVLVSWLPFVGSLLIVMSLPLLSLGFMIASQSALFGGPVTPLQFAEPLRGDPARRRALLLLCGLFGAGAVVIALLCDSVSNHAWQRLLALMAGGNASAEQFAAIADEPAVERAQLLLAGLASLLAVPFWHAPALVHWGGQGAGQALFSSTLAVWRCKGAFLVYTLVWVAATLVFSFAASLLLALSGALQAVWMLAAAAMLLFQTVFYVSLLFTFNDSFGGTEARPAEPA